MGWILIIILGFITLILGFVYFSNLIGLIWTAVPYVPLSKKQLHGLQEAIKLNHDDKLVDFGCGDGRVLRLFEKQGVEVCEGYEINFWAATRCKLTNKILKSKTKCFVKDFNKVDLSQYNVAFCYLLPSCLKKIRDKLFRELKHGSRIISYGFEIPGVAASQIIYTNEKRPTLGRIFVYVV